MGGRFREHSPDQSGIKAVSQEILSTLNISLFQITFPTHSHVEPHCKESSVTRAYKCEFNLPKTTDTRKSSVMSVLEIEGSFEGKTTIKLSTPLPLA